MAPPLSSSILCILLLVAQATTWPIQAQQMPMGLPPGDSNPDAELWSLPVFDAKPRMRVNETRLARKGYLYGPPFLGNTSYFPTGVLGDAMVARHKAEWFRDVEYTTKNVYPEWENAAAALQKAGRLRDLSSFKLLYEDQWRSTLPDGVAPGFLTNWTQDVLFSMERLSLNPYVVRCLYPQGGYLPFPVSDVIVRRLAAGKTLRDLHVDGRLFVADHSYQAPYPKTPGRWTAACTAYFFIHPSSGDFLPLAIKINMEADLTYTPMDHKNDWLFAKMAFGMNDLFHSQLYHLANTHDVAEPVHQAALRTMSSCHPIRGYLDRSNKFSDVLSICGTTNWEEFLFNEGGFYDSSFALPNFSGKKYASEAYWEHAGNFRATQFVRDLTDRGLIDCDYGPPLTHFPYYETVAPMVAAIEDFARVFVDSYYPEESILGQDHELQHWIIKANEEAKMIDFFPAPLLKRENLVSILSHLGFLSGIAHHSLNGATVGEALGVLPLQPLLFCLPLLETKGSIKSLLPYLHNETEALKQASLLVRFNRPLLDQQKRSLPYMFSGKKFLGHLKPAIQVAEEKFRETMMRISHVIRAKEFD